MVRSANPQEFDTTDIVAHIFYAVGNTDQVTVTTPAGDFTGTLEYPDTEGILIRAHTELPELPTSAPICVEYSGPLDAYRFYTEVLTARDGQLFASVPYALECSDRRLSQRIELPEESPFFVRLLDFETVGPVRLQDISVGGMAFTDPTDGGLPMGTRLKAELVLPNEPPMSCMLEVRHLSLRRGRLKVGARIATVSLKDRGRIARILLTWLTENGTEPVPGSR